MTPTQLPGVMPRLMPRPLLAKMKPPKPEGIAAAMPVGTRSVLPGAMTSSSPKPMSLPSVRAPSAAQRSQAALPPVIRSGSFASGRSRTAYISVENTVFIKTPFRRVVQRAFLRAPPGLLEPCPPRVNLPSKGSLSRTSRVISPHRAAVSTVKKSRRKEAEGARSAR